MSDAPLRSIGLIMDGNRRWAKARGLPTLEGHRKGYEKLKELVVWAKEADIKDTVVFGFSTENWNRAKEEVAYLMDLIEQMLIADAEEFKKQGVRLRIVGERERFSPNIQKAFDKAEALTRDGEYTLWLALSYGGRAEILDTTNRLIAAGKPVTEDEFSNALWTAGMPDPDIIVRTSGEQRLSGFLPWQGVYSELFFVETPWPAFSKDDFQNILDEYRTRDRRHGK
jgi:undecaprenyl diphosphate synthase